MKILILAPQPFYQERGTPIAIDNVLKVLSERGDQVDLLVYHEGTDVLYEHVTLHRTPALPFLRGIKPGFSWKKLLCDALMMPKAVMMVARGRYDLIHAVEETAMMALLFKRIFRIPYVYDMDSSLSQQMLEQLPWLRPAVSLFGWCEGLAVKHADAVVAVCPALAEGVRCYMPKKVVTLHDVSLLDGNCAVGYQDDLRKCLGIQSLLVMYVGNLQPYQGIDLLLKGFRLALEKQDTADLVVIGGTDDDIVKYRHMAEKLGITRRVHFVGPKPLQYLATYLLQADVLVSPRIKGNNTPMKIYSYLQSGKPLLATDLPTHTQVVNHESALLVAPTPVAWSKGMLTLMEDAELRTRIGRAGRCLVETQFSYPAFSHKLNELLDWLATSLKYRQGEVSRSSG